jgi:hypothetical protein
MRYFTGPGVKVLELLSATPLATMEPEVFTSRRVVDTDEEQGYLLQQSEGSPSPHDMVDQHPEFSASEAEDVVEEEIAGQ